MKIGFVFLLSLVFHITLEGQHSFRPIIDSSKTCSYHNYVYGFSESIEGSKQILEIYYIVESMPYPLMPLGEIERKLPESVILNSHELTLNDEIFLQCVINCEGKAGDFQLVRCSNELVNVACQTLKYLSENFIDWEPGIQKGNAVDVLIQIQLKINSGEFNLVAPYY